MDVAAHCLMDDLKWTRERLRNWGRWSTTRRVLHTCYSAEGRFRPERLVADGDEEEMRRTPRIEVDVLDAHKVWTAVWPHHGMPMALAFVLHGTYVWRLKGEALRAFLRHRGMSVRGRDLADLLHEAEVAAHNRIARLDRRDAWRV